MNNNTNQEQHEPSREAEQVDDAATREAALQKAREVLAKATNADERLFNPHISMYSLALTLLQLVELYDNQPGKDRRFKLLDEIAKEFQRFTGIRCR